MYNLEVEIFRDMTPCRLFNEPSASIILPHNGIQKFSKNLYCFNRLLSIILCKKAKIIPKDVATS